MDYKRLGIAVGLIALLVAGYLIARDAAQVYLYLAGFAGSYRYDILFDTHAWAIPVAGGLGILFGALANRIREPRGERRNGVIRRHDAFGTFLEHWTVAVGGILLIVSGLLLGFLFIPRIAGTTELVGIAFNLHFIGVLLMLFGGAYHVTNHWMANDYGILPDRSDLAGSVKDIGHYLRLTGKPKAEKYLPIQKTSYVVWAVLLGVLALTGLVKASAYVVDISPALAGAMTLIHDVFALLTIVFFVLHVAVVLMPSHLPLLRSQFTGWIPEDYVREHHPKWYDRFKE